MAAMIDSADSRKAMRVNTPGSENIATFSVQSLGAEDTVESKSLNRLGKANAVGNLSSHAILIVVFVELLLSIQF